MCLETSLIRQAIGEEASKEVAETMHPPRTQKRANAFIMIMLCAQIIVGSDFSAQRLFSLFVDVNNNGAN